MGVSKVWLAGPLRGTVAAAPALVTIQVPSSTFHVPRSSFRREWEGPPTLWIYFFKEAERISLSLRATMCPLA